MVISSTPVPKLVHMAAHMRGSLNFQQAESSRLRQGESVVQWETLGKRYRRLVDETIIPISAPPFTRLKAPEGSGSFHQHVEVAKLQFLQWHDYVYDLIVASWAFRVGLDNQMKDNLFLVRGQWEQGGRLFVRGHADVGLVDQIPSLRAALEMPDDNIRFDAMTLGSSVLEELAPGMLSGETEQLAVALHASARTFLLNEEVSYYRQAASILALQRSLCSIPLALYAEARRDLLALYTAQLNEEDTMGNFALLRSIGGLISTLDSHVPKAELKLLQQLEDALQRIAEETKSGALKTLVQTVLWKIPSAGRRDEGSRDPYAVQVYSSGNLEI